MPGLRYTSVVSACLSVFHPPAAPAAVAWLLAAVYVRGGAVSGCSSMVGQRRCDTDWTKFKDAAQSSSTPHMAGIEVRPSQRLSTVPLMQGLFSFSMRKQTPPMHRIFRTLHLRDLRARWVASLSTGSGCGVMCVPHIGWWWTGEAAFWFTQSSGAAVAAGGLLWSHNRSITKESHVGCRGEWRHRLKS